MVEDVTGDYMDYGDYIQLVVWRVGAGWVGGWVVGYNAMGGGLQ